MRPTFAAPRLLPQISRPSASRRETDEKRASEAKPPKKRSLNEGAHKLGY